MRWLRYVLAALVAIFGGLILARAVEGPFSLPVSVRTPINVESLCALLITIALLLGPFDRGTSDRGPSNVVKRGEIAAAAALLVILVAAGFWRSIGIYFLADDFVLVTRANAFRVDKVKELLTTAEASAFFRPIVHLTMAFTAQWAHFDPRLWRLNALALHAANSVLVFAIAARLGLSRGSALFAGALFAIHACLPESVVWIAGWFGTLSTFFVLLGLVFFLDHLDSKGRARMWLSAASFLAMVLALIAKETAFAFPMLAALLAWHRGARWRVGFNPREALVSQSRFGYLLGQFGPALGGFFGGALVIFAYRWTLLGGIGGYAELGSGAPLMMKLGPLAVARSLLLRLWAVLFFPVNWSHQPATWLGLLMAAYVTALVYLALRARSGRLIVFSCGFVLLAALPPLEQLLIGPDLQKSRELYLPLVGFSFLLATALEAIAPRLRWAIASAVLAFNIGALEHNITIWRAIGTLAQQTCAAAARCSTRARVSAAGIPGSLDGVYFLGVGFPECFSLAGQSAPPIAEGGQNLVWNADRRALECER
jgi:hypothetical protein